MKSLLELETFSIKTDREFDKKGLQITAAPLFYSPRIAVIPGSFLPSMYSSIAPPPVDT
jgi:hypothetical protein